jgi:hypothetical protein
VTALPQAPAPTSFGTDDLAPDADALVTVEQVRAFNPLNELIVGHTIDHPKAGAVTDEFSLSLGGWVAGRSAAPAAVDVIAGGRTIRSAPITLFRPGVAARFPVEGAVPTGYSFRLGVLGLPPRFELLLRARFADGTSAPLGTITATHKPVLSRSTPRFSPLMVTSLGRMGTTWLMRLLSEHPEIVVYREYPHELMICRYWVHQLRVLSAPADYEASCDPDSFANCLTSVGHNPYYGPMIDPSPVLRRWLGRDHVEDLATFCVDNVERFYALMANLQARESARYFAEKYLPDHTPTLTRDLYPGAKEIFLVRDIRDVVCSMLAFNAKRGYRSFGRDNVTSDADFVRQLADAMQALIDSHRARAESSLLVRYEDLIISPERVLDTILCYLDLPRDDHVVQQMIERSAQDTRELVAHRTSANPVASIGRWRCDLDPDLLVECEDALAAFGYDREGA